MEIWWQDKIKLIQRIIFFLSVLIRSACNGCFLIFTASAFAKLCVNRTQCNCAHNLEKYINTKLAFASFALRRISSVGSFCTYTSVHHHFVVKIKQSRCDWSKDFNLRGLTKHLRWLFRNGSLWNEQRLKSNRKNLIVFISPMKMSVPLLQTPPI